MLNVAPRGVERGKVIHFEGVSEVREAFDRGEVGVSAEGQYRNYAARATGPQSIEKGRRVRVVRMAGGDLIVEEVQG